MSQSFDDDRLLAFALGLEDDEELRAALAAQPLLQRRLDALTADLEHIEAELHAVVPPAGPAYERPADETWSRLRPYFDAPAASSRASRRAMGRAADWRWGRLVASAAALLVVVASVGVVLTLHGQGGGSTSGGSLEAKSTAGQADTTAQGAAGALPAKAEYGVVVVARAGRYSAGSQRFTVVRVLKGHVGPAVALVLPPAAAVKAGEVRLLYLQPLARTTAPSTRAKPVATPAYNGSSQAILPAPSPSTGSVGVSATSASYAGHPALIVPLPAGAAPDTVRVP